MATPVKQAADYVISIFGGGSTIAAIVMYFIYRRKSIAEEKKLEAETRKADAETRKAELESEEIENNIMSEIITQLREEVRVLTNKIHGFEEEMKMKDRHMELMLKKEKDDCDMKMAAMRKEFTEMFNQLKNQK